MPEICRRRWPYGLRLFFFFFLGLIDTPLWNSSDGLTRDSPEQRELLAKQFRCSKLIAAKIISATEPHCGRPNARGSTREQGHENPVGKPRRVCRGGRPR